jgi:hypothetical protein
MVMTGRMVMTGLVMKMIIRRMERNDKIEDKKSR